MAENTADQIKAKKEADRKEREKKRIARINELPGDERKIALEIEEGKKALKEKRKARAVKNAELSKSRMAVAFGLLRFVEKNKDVGILQKAAGALVESQTYKAEKVASDKKAFQVIIESLK